MCDPALAYFKRVVQSNQENMRMIGTKTHGVIDYLVGALLLVSPWLFKFNMNGAEMWVPVLLGAGALVYSMCTDYELGMLKGISMRTHLNLDMFSGIVLAASPWLLGFYGYVYLPHLLIGIAEIGVALCTEKVPYHKHARITHLRSDS
jgi:hypothetical protein